VLNEGDAVSGLNCISKHILKKFCDSFYI